jgi:hypothetical protein
MAELAESGATLVISGDGLDPDEVSRVLGAEPDLTARKGEAITLPGGGQRIADTGFWRRNTASRQPAELDAQIAALFAGLSDAPATWQALATRFAVNLHVTLYLDNTNEATALSPETTALIGARHAQLRLEIYAPYTPAGSCGG